MSKDKAFIRWQIKKRLDEIRDKASIAKDELNFEKEISLFNERMQDIKEYIKKIDSLTKKL
jgi:hypothetical protein